MADLAKTVGIVFSARDDASPVMGKVSAALKSMQDTAEGAVKGVGQFAGNLKAATEPMADLTVGLLKFEAGLMTAGAAATLLAVKMASDFDSSFRQLTTLFDASAEDVAKFRGEIQAFASTSTRPINDIMNALLAAVGSGVDYSKSLGLISAAEKLAVATRADMTATTEVLVSTLNAYGMKTDDAGKVADIFFQTIKDGKIEMDDLSRSFAMVTPLAAASGVSLQEVGAAVAAMTAAGMQPGQAIEYLRSALTNMVKPSEIAIKAAADMGIEFGAAALKSKGLAGMLDDMARATGGNTGEMSKLIGDVGGLTAALVLTGPQAENFRTILDGMGSSAGSVAEAFAKMAGSLDNEVAKAGNAFRLLMISIGTPMLDEFGGIAKAVGEVFIALGDSVRSGPLKGLVSYVEGIAGDIEAALATVAKNLPAALGKADLGGFTGAIDAVRAAFGRLFGGIDIGTVDGLTKAIELAGAAFLGLGKFTGGVIDSFKPLFDALVGIGNQAGKLSPEFFALVGSISGAATQINLLAGGVNSMLPAFEALLNLVLLKQGLGLLGAFAGMTAALPALTTALTAFGLAAATYFATDKVIDLVGALGQWKNATEHLAQAQQDGADIQRAAIPTLEKFAETTGIAVKSIDEANDLVSKGAVVWDDAVNGWVKAAAAQAQSADASDDQKDAVLRNAQAMMDAADKAARFETAQDGVAKTTGSVRAVIDATTGKVVGYEQAAGAAGAASTDAAGKVKGLGDQVGKSAAEMQKAKDAADRFAVEMEKIASNERIKLMEFQVNLDIANLEEGTKRIQAAFESINVGIESTGSVISDSIGALKDLTSHTEAFDIVERQLEKENQFRRESFDLQKRLTEEQIALVRAQIQATERDSALVQVDGAGLQPHLEAFMWEILKAIQVRVNSQGLKMLLGI
ncbi:MAG TPA: phage tail tape measure protein [Ottowia sp.]|nr:phage tail tape measure protein [Ottowia sp.]